MSDTKTRQTRNLLVPMALVCGTLAAAGTAEAGVITFYEGNNGTQDVVAKFGDDATVDLDLKSDNMGIPNNEARSVTLSWVRPGTRIRVYDSPSGSTDDDWTDIYVRQLREMIVITAFDKNVDNADVQVSWHKDNGIDGKVSRIRIYPTDGWPARQSVQTEVLKAWDATHGGFPAKRGQAFEFSSGDHQYRTYRPALSSVGGVWFVSWKMDHIRGGAGDDHVAASFSMDGTGKISRVSTTVSIDGKNPFSVAVDVANEIPEAANANIKVVIAKAAVMIAEEVYAKVLEMNETGGRLLLPQQVQHEVNSFAGSLASAIETP
jgi:hypothetical protein